MAESSAAAMAGAMRNAAELSHERQFSPGSRATVLAVEPLRLDLHGSDLELGPDVAIGRSVRAVGFDVGDVLVLVHVDDDEWIAVDVED